MSTKTRLKSNGKTKENPTAKILNDISQEENDFWDSLSHLTSLLKDQTSDKMSSGFPTDASALGNSSNANQGTLSFYSDLYMRGPCDSNHKSVLQAPVISDQLTLTCAKCYSTWMRKVHLQNKSYHAPGRIFVFLSKICAFLSQ